MHCKLNPGPLPSKAYQNYAGMFALVANNNVTMPALTQLGSIHLQKMLLL